MIAWCTFCCPAYFSQISQSGSIVSLRTRSSVTISNSLTDLLYSGGFPLLPESSLPESYDFKGFILEKCQHCRCQGFRHTVDLINKQDSLFPACILHTIIDRCHDLTHCVICHHHSFSTVIPFNDLRKTDGTLTGVMGNGVGYKSHTALLLPPVP